MRWGKKTTCIGGVGENFKQTRTSGDEDEEGDGRRRDETETTRTTAMTGEDEMSGDEDDGGDAVVGSSNGPGYCNCMIGRPRKRQLHGDTAATPEGGRPQGRGC